jgi:hypothetical protein
MSPFPNGYVNWMLAALAVVVLAAIVFSLLIH